MKKLFAVLALFTLAACHHDLPPDPDLRQQTQYQQQAPGTVMLQPTPQPVIIQQAAPQSDHSGTALVAGAAAGALAMHMLSNSNANNAPAVVQQATPTTIINRTTIVNHTVAAPVAAVVTPTPATVTPPAVVPAKTSSYVQGIQPVLAAQQAYKVKILTPVTAAAPTPAPMTYKPTPAPVSLVKSAPASRPSYAASSSSIKVSYGKK